MVYLIVDETNTYCKIGNANNVQKRLSQLQTGCPFRLRVESFCDGGARLEREMHRDLQEFRLSGEWFKYSDSIKSYFEEIKQDNRQDYIEVECEALSSLLKNLPHIKYLKAFNKLVLFAKNNEIHYSRQIKPIMEEENIKKAEMFKILDYIENIGFIKKIENSYYCYKLNKKLVINNQNNF